MFTQHTHTHPWPCPISTYLSMPPVKFKANIIMTVCHLNCLVVQVWRINWCFFFQYCDTETPNTFGNWFNICLQPSSVQSSSTMTQNKKTTPSRTAAVQQHRVGRQWCQKSLLWTASKDSCSPVDAGKATWAEQETNPTVTTTLSSASPHS